MPRPIANWQSHLGLRLKLRDLHILLTVVQWGSMAKGATHLGMSQPAVSESITGLEDTLGVRLLDRNPRGVEPTIYARALLKRGSVVFDELKQGIRDIEFLTDPGRGEVRIGCPESLCAGFVPAIIDRLTRRYPRVSVQVVVAQPGEQEFRELRDRSVDLLLGRVFKAVSADDVATEIVCDDAFFVVTGTNSPWSPRRRLALSELLHEPWVMFPVNSLSGAYIAEAFRAHGVELPRQRIETFSIQIRLHLLATARFLTVLHGSVLRFNSKAWGLKVLPFGLSSRPMPIAIFKLKSRTVSPVVQAFIEEARHIATSTEGSFARRLSRT